MPDHIEIRGLEVSAQIGVPDAERANPQELRVDVWMVPLRDFSAMPDTLDATVDYHAVTLRIAAISAARPRQLIEILADDLATAILREFAVTHVEITVRKFILPNTEWVAVHCVRERIR